MEQANFWLVSAGKDGELWPIFWRERKIAIGWSALGDLRAFGSKDELMRRYKEVWPEESAHRVGACVSQLWNLLKLVKAGDVVFVRAHGALLGLARVVGDYEFLKPGDPLREKFHSAHFKDDYPHARTVEWVSLWGGMKQPLTLTQLTVMKEVP